MNGLEDELQRNSKPICGSHQQESVVTSPEVAKEIEFLRRPLTTSSDRAVLAILRGDVSLWHVLQVQRNTLLTLKKEDSDKRVKLMVARRKLREENRAKRKLLASNAELCKQLDESVAQRPTSTAPPVDTDVKVREMTEKIQSLASEKTALKRQVTRYRAEAEKCGVERDEFHLLENNFKTTKQELVELKASKADLVKQFLKLKAELSKTRQELDQKVQMYNASEVRNKPLVEEKRVLMHQQKENRRLKDNALESQKLAKSQAIELVVQKEKLASARAVTAKTADREAKWRQELMKHQGAVETLRLQRDAAVDALAMQRNKFEKWQELEATQKAKKLQRRVPRCTMPATVQDVQAGFRVESGYSSTPREDAVSATRPSADAVHKVETRGCDAHVNDHSSDEVENGFSMLTECHDSGSVSHGAVEGGEPISDDSPRALHNFAEEPTMSIQSPRVSSGVESLLKTAQQNTQQNAEQKLSSQASLYTMSVAMIQHTPSNDMSQDVAQPTIDDHHQRTSSGSGDATPFFANLFG